MKGPRPKRARRRFPHPMPTSVVPKAVIEPDEPSGPGQPPDGPDSDKPSGESRPAVVSTSRWIDYNTHELLEMISELEDERRWARLREGMLWAILFHILLISAVTWIPRYVLKVPPVIDPFKAIQERKDLQYLDLPPDLVKKYAPKVEVKPVPKLQPQIDKKTLEALKQAAPPAPAPEPKQEAPAPQPQQQAQMQPPPPPNPQSQSQLEAPQPKAVPARPNFSMGSQNPAQQLQDAMRGAASSHGYGAEQPAPGEMRMHPGAGAGGVQVLSDTQGVDFNGWLRKWYFETEHTWDPLIPDEVNPPILKSGAVQIRFKVLPNGRVTDMQLEGRSGDTALDRAAWGAITGSNYPPLPHEFHGPYLELRAVFMYNMRQQ